ncbi:MAG TPA: hypothetical protein ENJ25_01290 [Firmicutes bacterium]|uniref:Uncharacterized protein n=1 Tax=candidate division TA06 bacterium TaxID=2250710 RepID=A0A660SAG1_UNCT6|nr:hypothetical protein [candidate division WOR-3 bacterium]RKX67729.1 MAG: hypothetical protein DRP44_01665 [candidate division TA06 bacterium]HFD04760.1 hypothetical protein [Bacillota bacterium]
MSNNIKIVIVVLGLFLYLSVKIVHDRMYLQYGRLKRTEIKLSKQKEKYKSAYDSLITFNRIVRIAKEELNMVFPKGNQKRVIE